MPIPFISVYLVGGFKHFYFPFHIWVVILPIDELIFFKETTNQPFISIVFYVSFPKKETSRSFHERCDRNLGEMWTCLKARMMIQQTYGDMIRGITDNDG